MAFQDLYSVSGSFSLITSIDIELLNYVAISGKYQREWFTNGFHQESFSAQLNNAFRDPFANIGFIQYLDFQASGKVGTWQTPSTKKNMRQLNATLGIRF